MLKMCNKCHKQLAYLDNEKNNYCFLICPRCHSIDDSERYVTVQERIKQGYQRYERAEEAFAQSFREKFLENDDI